MTKYYHHLQYIIVHYCGKFETNAHIPRHIYIYVYVVSTIQTLKLWHWVHQKLLSSTGLLLTQIPCGGDSMKR